MLSASTNVPQVFALLNCNLAHCRVCTQAITLQGSKGAIQVLQVLLQILSVDNNIVLVDPDNGPKPRAQGLANCPL